MDGMGGNPLLTVVKGYNYTFTITTPNFLFALYTNPGVVGPAGRYNEGVQGQATDQVLWSVSPTAPPIVYYQSESIPAMFGQIQVVNNPTTGSAVLPTTGPSILTSAGGLTSTPSTATIVTASPTVPATTGGGG